jgi:acyl-CoA thioesterase FadM
MDYESGIVFRAKLDEMDGNGHIGNGIIIGDYFERGRRNLLAMNGLDPDSLRSRGISVYVKKHIEYDHIRQIIPGYIVQVRSRFGGMAGKARFLVEQALLAEGKLAATGKVHYCFANIKSGKPIRPPEDLIDIVSE